MFSFQQSLLHAFCGSIIVFSLCNTAYAEEAFSPDPFSPTKYVTSFSLGAVQSASSRGAETFKLTPTIKKTYTADQNSDALAAGEFMFGLQKSIDYRSLMEVGIAIAAVNHVNLSGDIWDDGLSQFDNFTYHYHLQHTHVALKAKVFMACDFDFIPWLSASVGVGFNKSSHFTNTPTIFEALPNENFGDHTTTAFTYTVGVGLEYFINSNWHAGIGYEFSDWGESSLDGARDQTIGHGLSLSHFYTNGIMFSLTYT